MSNLERWFPPVPKALLERTVMGGAKWRVLYSYAQLMMGVSLKAQDQFLSSHLPSLNPTHSGSYDLIVVGGGIVGMATAREVALRYPNMTVGLVEKENELALHQTGHNSGVIHMGLYYPPGSLKAKLCVKGAEMIYRYLDNKNIPYKKCGKVIVAVNDEEIVRLKALYVRALSNGCKDIRLINGQELRIIEPHCQGKMAIHSPHTGIVDWAKVTRAYAEDFKAAGGQIHTNYEVCGFVEADSGIVVQAKNGASLTAKWVITCCGLYADRVAMLSGSAEEPKVVPFRGEYLVLDQSKSHLVRGNIYPVPNPQFPFLGVHFTPQMDGSVWVGPNAVLAFSREGYSYFDVNWSDLTEMLSFKGLQKLIVKHWRFGAGEMYRSINKRAQLKHAQKFIPQLHSSDLHRGPAGVRAQTLDSDGSLLGDFIFDQGVGSLGQNMLHVRNAPSPGATSSLAIAEMIADKAVSAFQWQ